jgi:MraZ protein
VSFVGLYDFSLDPKGRVVIPARLRDGFETKQAYVCSFPEGCAAVFTVAEFNRRFLARAMRLDRQGQEGRDLARALSSQSQLVDIDAQWRLTVPPRQRSFALLEPNNPVVVVGAISRVELWQPERWDARFGRANEKLLNGTDIFVDDDEADLSGTFAEALQA